MPLLEAVAHVVTAAEVDQVDTYRRLARAVLAGRAEQARDEAAKLLAAGTAALIAVIDSAHDDRS